MTLLEQLAPVFSGTKQQVKIENSSLSELEDHLKETLNVDIHSYDLDTNGWEWDFWKDFDIGDTKYRASGTGYTAELYFEKIN